MAETASTMLALGTKAPDFHLADTEGTTVSLEDFEGKKALLVVFMCNHCPFVKHIIRDFVNLAKEYQSRGVGVVGINANDYGKYPEDAPDKMRENARALGFTFPYLLDESQEVARAYRAACTPDFFLFDKELKLVYRGQMDESRPHSAIPVTGKDLRAALDTLLAGGRPGTDQKPSLGCNIKWKPGKEPGYFSH